MLPLDIRTDRPTTTTATPSGELASLAVSVHRQWPQLRSPIVLEWSDRPVVALDRGAPWLYGPADRDPLMGAGGPVAVPRRQRRQLEEVAARGPRFHAVAVAHELDPDGPVRSLLPQLRHGPRTCTDEVARELVGPAPAHPAVVRVAGLLDSLVGGAALAAAAGALDAVLDPIVFGVLAPAPLAHGTPSLWFPLAVWRW